MDKETKMGFIMFALVGAIFAGVGYMATGQSNSSLLVPALALLVAAVFFWLWLRRDENSATAAHKSLENAEKSMRDATRSLKVPIQSDDDDEASVDAFEMDVPVKTAPPAFEPVPPVLDTMPPMPPSINPPSAPDINLPGAPDIQPPSAPDINFPEPPVIEPGLPPTINPPHAPQIDPPSAPDINPPAAPQIDPPSAPDINPPSPPVITPPQGKVAVEIGDVAGDDDLTRLEGIGPRFRDILVAAGVKTFAQLAGTTEDRLIEIIRQAGARKPGSVGTWASQADMAAKGDWEALDAYQKTLTGGRKTE